MKVSLTMIVKDEVEDLGECLDSIEDLVDEIVIVDTGSTDGTLEVVKERADVWEQIPWTGFADARNRAIELASGDVLVALDADERIIGHEGWEHGLKVLEDGADACAFILYNELPENQMLKADRMWQLRMWWNRPEARWTGRVHNQLAQMLKEHPRDGEEATFHQVPVSIRHKGYNLTPEKMRAKYRARIEDLLKEIEEASSEQIKAYYQFQTSNAYFMVGEKGKSLQYARDCDIDKLTHENAYSMSMMAVSSCHTLGLVEEALEWSKVLMRIWPKELMSFLMMGLSYMGLEKHQTAMNFLSSVLSMSQETKMGYKYLVDTHYVAGAAGECMLALNRLGEAKELFRMHLQEHETPRIRELEKAIISMDEARARGLVDEEGKRTDLPQEDEGREAVEIPDLRKTG